MQQRRRHDNHYNDPFGMDDDDEFGIGFGIRDDFDDPFDQMMGNFRFPNIGEIHQRIFGNFGRDFGGQIGDGNEGHNRHRDREEISQGSNMFQGFFSMQGTGPGTVISKSYCNKVDYRDGRPHQECYQSQSINQIGKDGHKISEKQEAYKNSRTGIQKAAHQRILDGKGMKQIRQRNVNTGAQEEHNIFKGMAEDELNDFNHNYNDYRNKIGFQKNYKYLNGLNPYKRGKSQNILGNGNRYRNNNKMLQLGDGNINYQPYQKKHQHKNHKK